MGTDGAVGPYVLVGPNGPYIGPYFGPYFPFAGDPYFLFAGDPYFPFAGDPLGNIGHPRRGK